MLIKKGRPPTYPKCITIFLLSKLSLGDKKYRNHFISDEPEKWRGPEKFVWSIFLTKWTVASFEESEGPRPRRGGGDFTVFAHDCQEGFLYPSPWHVFSLRRWWKEQKLKEGEGGLSLKRQRGKPTFKVQCPSFSPDHLKIWMAVLNLTTINVVADI